MGADRGPSPPVAAIVRSGRGGGGIRLKLYLSLLWIASEKPYDVTMPARTWASLLRLPSPEDRGARRVSEAISWLEQESFVHVERPPGRPSILVPLDECACQPYRSPVTPFRDEPFPDRDRYIRLSAGMWTNGWIGTLSGAALATLLTLLEFEKYDDPQPFWISPSRAKELYGLSESTRQRGIRELKDLGVVEIEKRFVTYEAGRNRFVRNIFVLNHGRFREKPRRRASRDEG
jgi:hypothetical protein